MEITTRNGYTFQVDDEDAVLAMDSRWYCNEGHTSREKYIVRVIHKNGKKTLERLHRIILAAKNGQQCDHKNGDTLDNRRSNLRICNNAQNRINSVKNLDNTSGYKGVTWSKKYQKWQSTIGVNGRNLWLGYFDVKEDAALVYNEAAIKYFGEFARLNEIK